MKQNNGTLLVTKTKGYYNQLYLLKLRKLSRSYQTLNSICAEPPKLHTSRIFDRYLTRSLCTDMCEIEKKSTVTILYNINQ